LSILVTGGAGYIGSHTVVELIQSGRKPFILDDFRNSIPETLAGIRSIAGVMPPALRIDCASADFQSNLHEIPKIEAIIHFAALKSVAESRLSPLEYYQNNIFSLLNILNYAKEHQIRKFIFSSSATVYGQADELPVTETSPIKEAESVYGSTKQICETIIRDFQIANPDFQAVILRYFNPVGAHPEGLIGELPRGIPNNLVPYITQTAMGRIKMLTVFGNDYPTEDGTCIRDFIHVVDLAKAHVASLDYLDRGGKSDIFNIGTGKGNSVLEVIKTFERVNNIKLNWAFGPRRPGDIIKIWTSVEKALKILRWKSERNLENAMCDAWRWEMNREQ